VQGRAKLARAATLQVGTGRRKAADEDADDKCTQRKVGSSDRGKGWGQGWGSWRGERVGLPSCSALGRGWEEEEVSALVLSAC